MRLTFILLLSWSFLNAQDTLSLKKVQVSGYVKDMQSLNFQNDLRNLTTGNLVHNRLNFKWTPSGKITGALELRNRLFWGEEVGLVPGFSSQLRNRTEAADLSINWVDSDRIVFNSTIDRLWFEYYQERWNARIGRQRINWGIGTNWNPNDLFNSFNFLDFDYEERPGADAVKFQYFTGLMNYFEFAFSVVEENTTTVGAAKYFMNASNYDFQFIAGWFYGQPTIGMGWSGSIGQSGFKGEAQYYIPKSNAAEQINITMEADYVFESGWYINGGILYNSRGITKPPELWEITKMNFSPQHLMPTKWNTILTLNKEITPLFNASASFIYTPATNLAMILPTFTYSLTEDLDFNLIWQSFFGEQLAGFNDIAHRVFLRFKWSF